MITTKSGKFMCRKLEFYCCQTRIRFTSDEAQGVGSQLVDSHSDPEIEIFLVKLIVEQIQV